MEGREWHCLRHYHHRGLVLGRASWEGPGGEKFTRWPFEGYSCLGFVLEGGFEVALPDRGIEKVSAGEMFLSAGDREMMRMRIPDGLEILWLSCDRRVWETLLPRMGDRHDARDCVGCDRREEVLFVHDAWTTRVERLCRDLDESAGEAGGPLRVASLSLELLMAAKDAPLLNRTPSATPCLRHDEREALEEAARYLESHLDENHTIARLSRRVHLNEFKLKKGFREYYRTTIFSYLRRKRMERAYDLLTRQRLSVMEAACAVGYANPSHFSRAFRREFGVNPKALQRSVRAAR